jgi:hypothetical protein
MTMKKLFALALVALVSVGVVAYAQSPGTPVGIAVADDTSIAALVRYVGSNSSATVAVAANGDLTFEVGGSAYTGFECPVSGALGGIIDVSDAACNTLGEVIDTINGNCTGCSSDFRAVLIDGLRTDSSNDSLLTFGTTQVTRTDGYPLYFDTDTVIFAASYAILPNRTNIAGFLGGPATGRKLLENPYNGQQAFLRWFEAKSTYGSGTSDLYVYSVKASNKPAGAETVTTLWGPEAMAATTVNKQFTYWQTNMLPGRKNEKLIVRVKNSAAMASTAGFAAGEVKSSY